MMLPQSKIMLKRKSSAKFKHQILVMLTEDNLTIILECTKLIVQYIAEVHIIQKEKSDDCRNYNSILLSWDCSELSKWFCSLVKKWSTLKQKLTPSSADSFL